MGVSVVLLSYREAENLAVLIPRIQAAMQDVPESYEILVVDSEKPLDDTQGVCQRLGARYVNQEEPGYGGAFRTAIRHAGMDLLLNLDADGSHTPETIPAIYRKFTGERCDMVIGSRYVKGGTTLDSASSILMSKVLNFVMRLVLGVKAKDISTSFRLYDADQLRAITLARRNFDVLQEVVMRLKLNKPGFRIGEVPIRFEKRINGMSNRKLLAFIRSYIANIFMLLALRIQGGRKAPDAPSKDA